MKKLLLLSLFSVILTACGGTTTEPTEPIPTDVDPVPTEVDSNEDLTSNDIDQAIQMIEGLEEL